MTRSGLQENAMSVSRRQRRWPAVLLGGMLAASAWGQVARAVGDPPLQDPTQILSDVQPLPAEDRDSTGALMDASRMGVHQDTSAAQPAGNAVKPVVGNDISRLADRTRTWDDVRDADSAQPTGEASGAPPEPAQR
jgi:hypothetical protein